MSRLPDPLQDLIIQYVDLMILAYEGFGEGQAFAVIPAKGSTGGGGVRVKNAKAHRMLRDMEYRIRLMVRETDREMEGLR